MQNVQLFMEYTAYYFTTVTEVLLSHGNGATLQQVCFFNQNTARKQSVSPEEDTLFQAWIVSPLLKW